MPRKKPLHIMFYLIFLILITGCYHPPYNNFKRYNRSAKDVATGSAIGAIMGAAVGFPAVGTAIGATAVTGIGLYQERKKNLLRLLKKGDVEYVQYGDTMVLIIPTDRYYLFNSARFNQLCYPTLYRIIKLLSLYPRSPIYVAGFTDDVGSRHDKRKMSQAQAETMLTFLWANGFQSARLRAEGYGDQYAVSSNKIIHGSAQNRRIEIQWFVNPLPDSRTRPYIGPSK